MISLLTPEEVLGDLAARVRETRLAKNMTQAEVARRARMALRTYQLFENTGRGNLAHFARILLAFGSLHELETLVQPPLPLDVDRRIDKRLAPRRRAGKSVK